MGKRLALDYNVGAILDGERLVAACAFRRALGSNEPESDREDGLIDDYVPATTRVRLKKDALSAFYEPPHLARLLTTLEVLSDGRLDVGVGLGWMKDEHDIARGANWHRREFVIDAGMVASKDAYTHHRNGNRIVGLQGSSRMAGCQREQRIVNAKAPFELVKSLLPRNSHSFQDSNLASVVKLVLNHAVQHEVEIIFLAPGIRSRSQRLRQSSDCFDQ